MKKLIQKMMLLLIGLSITLIITSNAVAVLIDFNISSPPEHTALDLAYGGTYTEDGMIATSYADNCWIGDPLYGNTTNGLYFHGASQYVDFRMTNGSLFDLISFDFLTNGYTDNRWLQTANGTTYLPGYITLTNITFSGAEYSDLEWFRIGTPSYATEIDNININTQNPVPEPATGLLLIFGLVGIVGIKKKFNKKIY